MAVADLSRAATSDGKGRIRDCLMVSIVEVTACWRGVEKRRRRRWRRSYPIPQGPALGVKIALEIAEGLLLLQKLLYRAVERAAAGG